MRTQRKAIVQLPEAMLERQRETFPESFDRDGTVATFALRAVAQRINDMTNASLAALGLNAAKYNYLVILYMAPGNALTMSQISGLIHTTNATVTSMIVQLERAGLLCRTVNESDGRSFVVSLTDEGRRLVEHAMPVHRAEMEHGMRELSRAERAMLAELLLKLGRGLDLETGDPDRA